jgi:hypothetical protein
MFLIIVLLGIMTFYQIKGLISLAEDKSIQNNFKALANGDCSKLPIIETKISDIKSKIKSACINPIVKILVKKVPNQLSNNICADIDSLESEMDKTLDVFRKACSYAKA